MKIPWSRGDFLRRRWLDRLVLDAPDAMVRAVTGRGDWPPYSLRSFVGGARNFAEAGDFFRHEFQSMRLLNPRDQVLDVGCGCGRIAFALAKAPELQEIGFRYTGMDIDRASIEWCQRHITPRDSRFQFYHADCHNPSYNPKGSVDPEHYRFPYPDSSFQLILLTSVLTHTLEGAMRNYLHEAGRVLAPRGVVYATFFLYQSAEQIRAGIDRHEAAFPFVHGHYALNREDRPSNAVAYQEQFVREVIKDAGLSVIEPAAHGVQDLLLLTKRPGDPIEAVLGDGWHELEKGCWRWTKQSFAVHLKPSCPGPRTLELRFRIPASVIEELGEIQMSATAADVPLAASDYRTAGDQIYSQPLPERLPSEGFDVQFRLSKAYRPKPPDSRELGVQVAFLSSCGAGYRPLDPIRAE